MIIYKAENKINGRIYIGKTVSDLTCRKRGHFKSAEKDSKLVFHCAIRKYGEENFEFSVLEECSSEFDLNTKEKLYISKYDSILPNGYNMTPGGDGHTKGYKSPVKGRHIQTEESKKIIREKRALQVFSEESNLKRGRSIKRAYDEGRRKPWNKGLKKETSPSVAAQGSFKRGHVPWNKGLKGFMKGRKAWNSGSTKETDPRLCKQAEKVTGRPSWNKGLKKETDPRVAQYAESLINSTAPGVWKKGQAAWNKGISYPQTEESNLKRSATMKGIPKSEKVRQNMILAQQARRKAERQSANLTM